ncbi:MAG: hypothetical protein IPM96_09835 [Ignavibacteria bacterium]|nr:hypothetical protein [Ignavibacteria bacterium]
MEIIQGKLGGSDVVFPSNGGEPKDVVTLSRPADKVTVVLQGFNSSFTDDDRNFRRLKVELYATLRSDRVTVDVSAKIRLTDKSPSGDTIYFTVLYVLLVERSGPITR